MKKILLAFFLIFNFFSFLKAGSCYENTALRFCGSKTADCAIYRDGNHGRISCDGGFYISGGTEKFGCNNADDSDINFLEIKNLPSVYFPDAGGSFTDIDVYFCTYNSFIDYARRFDNLANVTQDGTKTILTNSGNVNAPKWKITPSDSVHYTPQWYDNNQTNARPVRNCTGFVCGDGGTCSTKGKWPYGGDTPYDYDQTAHCVCDDGYHNINGDIHKECESDCTGKDCGSSSAGTCSIDGGNAHCACNSGYHRETSDVLSKCISDCTGVTSCGVHGTCSIDGGTAHCECDSGFQRSDDGNPLSECVSVCSDVNCGPHGSCVVNGSSHSCSCDAHYFWDTTPRTGFPDGKCVDQCSSESSFGHKLYCGHHGQCQTKFDGTPFCSCDLGYRPVPQLTGEEPTCEADCYYNSSDPQDPYNPDDEYKTSDFCGESSNKGICVVNYDKNTLSCECADGFKIGNDKLSCVDVCTDFDCESSNGGSCVAENGSPHCSCPTGFAEDFEIAKFTKRESWMDVINEKFYKKPICTQNDDARTVYYSFDGNQYETVNDASYSAVNDKLYLQGRAVRGDGILGKGLFFDGTKESFAFANSSNDLNFLENDKFTISFWVKPLGKQKNGAILFEKKDAFGIALGENNTLKWALRTEDNYNWLWNLTNLKLTADKWNFIVFQYDKTKINIYTAQLKDSDLSLNSTPYTGNLSDNISKLTFGKAENDDTNFLGWVDEFQIVKTVTSRTALRELFSKTKDLSDATVQQNEDDPCLNIVCPDTKICISSGSAFFCACPPDSYLNRISGKCIDVCKNKNCSNHGKCVVDSATKSGKCQCNPGFSGSNCENQDFTNANCSFDKIDDAGTCKKDSTLKIYYDFNDYGSKTIEDRISTSSDDKFDAKIMYDDGNWVSGVSKNGIFFDTGYAITKSKGTFNEASINGGKEFSYVLWYSRPNKNIAKKDYIPLLIAPEYEFAIVKDSGVYKLMWTLCTQGSTFDIHHDYNRRNYGTCRSYMQNVNNLENKVWHQFAFVFDSLNAKVYVDGHLMTTKSYVLTGANSGVLKPQGADNVLLLKNGNIDDFLLYKRALSDSEIANIYRSFPCKNETCGGFGKCMGGNPLIPACQCEDGKTKDPIDSFNCFSDEDLVFEDASLAKCIRETLKITTDKPIRVSDLLHLKRLSCESSNIFSVKNLAKATNLEFLDLKDNNISDIMSLVTLKKLKIFNIEYNCITQFPTLPETAKILGKAKQDLSYCAKAGKCSGFACPQCEGFKCEEGSICRVDDNKPHCTASCDSIKCSIGEICDESGEVAKCVSSCKAVHCGVYSTCQEKDGKATCVCKTGYKSLGNGVCTNSCAGNNCNGHGICRIDENNMPYCECDAGYKRYNDENKESCIKECDTGYYSYEKYCIKGYSDSNSRDGIATGDKQSASGDNNNSQNCEIKPNPDCDENDNDCECKHIPTISECFDETYLNTWCGKQHFRCSCPDILNSYDTNKNGIIDEGDEMDALPEEVRNKLKDFSDKNQNKTVLSPTVYGENGVKTQEEVTTSMPYPESKLEISSSKQTLNAFLYSVLGGEKQSNLTDEEFFNKWQNLTKNQPINSCESYIFQKYGDFLEASAIMTRFAGKPLSQMKHIFDLPVFYDWAKNRDMSKYSYLASKKVFDDLRTIHFRGDRNVFWRVLYLAKEQESSSPSTTGYHTLNGLTRMILLNREDDNINNFIDEFGSHTFLDRDLSIYERLRDATSSLFEGTETDFSIREDNFNTIALLKENLMNMLMYRANIEMRFKDFALRAKTYGAKLNIPKQTAKLIIEDLYNVSLENKKDPSENDLKIQTEVNMHKYLETENAKILNFKMEKDDYDDINIFLEKVLTDIDNRIRKIFKRASTQYSCIMTHSSDSWTDCEWHPVDALVKISQLIQLSGSKMEQDYQSCLARTFNSPRLFSDDSTREDDLGSNTMRIPTLSIPVTDDADNISEEECNQIGKTKIYTVPSEISSQVSNTLVENRNYLYNGSGNSWRDLEDYFIIFPAWSKDLLTLKKAERKLQRVCAAKMAKKALLLRQLQQEAEMQAAKTAADKMGDLVDMSDGVPKDGKGKDIGKWFSDYRQYGNNRAGIDFSYILGYNISNAIIGWNDLQPEMLDKISDTTELKKYIATELYKDMIVKYVEKKNLKVDDIDDLIENIKEKDTNFDANVQKVVDSINSCNSKYDDQLDKAISVLKNTINDLEWYAPGPFSDFLRINNDNVIDTLAKEMFVSFLEDSSANVCDKTGECAGAIDFEKELFRTAKNTQITNTSLQKIKNWIYSNLKNQSKSDWRDKVTAKIDDIHTNIKDLRFFLISDVNDDVKEMIPEMNLGKIAFDLTGFSIAGASSSFNTNLASDMQDFGNSISNGMDISNSYLDGVIKEDSGNYEIDFDFMKNAIANAINDESEKFDALKDARKDTITCTLPVLDLSYIDSTQSNAQIDKDTLPPFTFNTIVDGVIARVKGIAKGRLLTIPTAEVIAHARAGVTVLHHDIELIELTNYINTLYDEPQLKGANKKAVEKFKESSEGEISKFKLYQKYYILDFKWAININFNLPEVKQKSSISYNKKEARKEQKEKLKELYQAKTGKHPDGKTTEQLLHESVGKSQDFKSIASFSDFDKEIKLTDMTFEKDKTFMVGVVPVTVGFGFTLIASIGIGTDMNYGFDNGFAIGMQVGPVFKSIGFLKAGVGFDLGGIVRAWAGAQGELLFFQLSAPLSGSLMIKPEIREGYPEAIMYLSSELRPHLKLMEGSLGLFAEARICVWRVCKTKKATMTLVKFKPLVDKTFPDLLHIPELRVNLFSLSGLLSNYDSYLHQHE